MKTRIGRGRGSRSDRQRRNLQFASTRARYHMLAVTRIAITAAAFDAIAVTLPLYERESGAKGDVHIWLEPHVVNQLRRLRGPGESFSVILAAQD